MANVHFKSRRFVSALLCVSLLFSLSSCKKKSKDKSDLYSAGRVIEATDPYFLAEVDKVNIPVSQGKKLQNMSINECIYAGDFAVVSYTQIYQLPSEVEKQVNSSSITGEVFDASEYFISATALFDKKGVLIREIGQNNCNIYGVTVDKEGNIHMLYDMYEPLEIDPDATLEDAEKAIYEHHAVTQIEVIDASGNTLRTISVPEGIEDYSAWGSSFTILDDGTYAFSNSGLIHLYAPNGNPLLTLSDKDRSLIGSVVQSDGKNYVASEKRDLEEGNSLILKEVDLETGKLGDGIDISSLLSYGSVVSTKDGVFANSYSSFFKYDIAKETIEEVFNWNDTDVDRALMKNISCTPVSDNEILAVGHRSYDIDYPYLIHLTRAETNPHAGKKMIVIGGEHLSDCDDLVSFASLYSSRPENSARVVIVDYTAGMGEDESLANIERSIYLDTLSGSGPDILVNLYNSVAFRTDSIMEDMNQYIDGERGINRSEYFDNIMRACETDGHLYHIPVRFSLNGLCVNKSLVSNTGGWTYDEFFEASTKIPDQVSFLEGVLYNDLLELLLGASLPQFIDYENKTVDLDNEEMRRILETVKRYGVVKQPEDEGWYYMEKEIPGEGSISGDGDLTMEKIMEGMLAVWVCQMDSLYTISYWNFMCPGGAELLGYPGKEKKGMAVHPETSLGIVASSKSKGLAWDFIKAFMEYDVPSYQYPYGNSLRIAGFEQESQAIMKDRNAFRESYIDRPEMGKYMGATEVTEEDLKVTRALIENASFSTGGDPAIFDIICEEAAAYFAGDRSIDDVLKNIENRASIVVKEL